jgi:hypothetical protein
MTYNTKVYRKQGGAEMVIASGGTLTLEAGAVVNGLSHSLSGNLASGTIDLGPYLLSARKMSSAENFATGALHITTTGNPSLEVNSTVDGAGYLNWASADVTAIQLPPISMPADFAPGGGLRIDLFGESVGTGTASDAAAGFDVRCWSGQGDTEMGATQPNFTSTPGYQTVALASGDLSTAPLTVRLVPQAHAGRAFRLQGGRIRYNRTS